MNGGGPKRKITLEALVTARQKRRKDYIQGLRESILAIGENGNFHQMDTLLQVWPIARFICILLLLLPRRMFEQINSSLNKSFTWHTNMIGPPRRENNIRQQEPVEWFRIYYLEQAGGSKQSNMGGGRCVKIIDWTIPRRETLFSSMPPSDSLVYVTDP